MPPENTPDDDNIIADGQPEINVTLSEDRLKAFLTIEQTPPLPYKVTVDDIYDNLAALSVEHGIFMDRIDEIIANEEYPYRELIAEGTPPTAGKDGWLDYKVDLGTGGKAKEEGYRVDFFDLNLVQNINAGDVLVVLHPHEPGEMGKNVLGREIKPARVTKARLPKGKGTQIPEESPNVLVAAVNGFVRLDKKSFNQIVVEQEVKIAGDVDFSTGNLDVDGSVEVNRNVKEGFKIIATGNIVVKGVVEGAFLKAGGNITIKKGVIGGHQRATIQAGEDIAIRFANNADITAEGNLSIADEALNCSLKSDTVIHLGEEGKRSAGAIIGGQAIAGYEIRARNVGSESGTKTYLRVGERPALLERRRKMETDLQDFRLESKQLSVRLVTFKQRRQDRLQARYQRQAQLPSLKQQQAQFENAKLSLLAQAKQAGYLVHTEAIESLEAEYLQTIQTIDRIKNSIMAILSTKKSVSALSSDEQAQLSQLKSALKMMETKARNTHQQIAKRKSNPWANFPAAWRRELENNKKSLMPINTLVSRIEAENDVDEKLDTAIAETAARIEELEINLGALQDELKIVREQIEKQEKIKPRVIVTETLWASTEVVISRHKKEFADSLKSVQVHLTGTEQKHIAVVGI